MKWETGMACGALYKGIGADDRSKKLALIFLFCFIFFVLKPNQKVWRT
jgi:hypothetical protein